MIQKFIAGALAIVGSLANARRVLLGSPSKRLLTTNNAKIVKGQKEGYFTALLHLAPHTLSGHNVCRWSTPGCRAACLNFAGQGGIGTKTDGMGNIIKGNNCQQARIKRTHALYDNPSWFIALLILEIDAHVRKCKRIGMKPAVRLNGTSDIDWAFRSLNETGEVIFNMFPDVSFYDYTKDPIRCGQAIYPNYHVLFSRSETPGSHRMALRHLHAGFDVAVVFEGPLPDTWHGFKVYDGDLDDLRFRSQGGQVCGLLPKGHLARRDTSGFVVRS